MQTVKNKTTVLILVFKGFLETSIRPLISVLYAEGYHDFPLKNFCLTVPKNFVEEPFCVSENFWYRKMLGIREGAGITIFCQNYFVSQYRKFLQGNPSVLCFRKFPVANKFMDKKGGGDYQDFPPKIFCLAVPKNFVGGPFSVSLISGIEKFYASEGHVTIFRRKFFVSQHRKFLQGNPSVLCFKNFR